MGHRGKVLLRGENAIGADKSADLKEQRVKGREVDETESAKKYPARDKMAVVECAGIGSELRAKIFLQDGSAARHRLVGHDSRFGELPAYELNRHWSAVMEK